MRNCLRFLTLSLVAFALNASLAAAATISLDGVWRICADPENVGVERKWYAAPLQETSAINTPGVLQEVFREYHGVVWYEREFETPSNPYENGRAILRFWQVEYRADVWLNGEPLGWHEGGEEMFEFDATAELKPVGEKNRLTVRVLNAADQPIDGISMANIPRRNNTNTIVPGCGYASGGIVDSVELIMAPIARISDVQLLPDWQTGVIEARITVDNVSEQAIEGRLQVAAASADGGEFTEPVVGEATFKAGDSTTVSISLVVPDFKLWKLNDPNLYNVVVDLSAPLANVSDRRTATCGFRDFRFENGYFRLNGKRIYVKCSHSGSDSPITHRVPLDPDLYRKDIITCKTMGFNMIRYIAGMPRRFQLDLCDRIGFLVYDECLAGWMYADCPERFARWDAQTSAMIRRDRNHPSVVIWGLLNETTDSQLVLHAAAFLEQARRLDPSRMVFLNSGGFDAFASDAAKTANYAIWRANNGAIMPGAIKNETDKTFFFDGTEWPSGSFFLHPGDVGNEYAVLKWTAPQDGAYRLDASFRDVVVHGSATVDLHLVKETSDGARSELWRGWLNLNGSGKFVRLTSSPKASTQKYRIFADFSRMKDFNVSTIALFDALRAIQADLEFEKVDQTSSIVVKATLRPGASVDEILSMTVVDFNGETVAFSNFGKVERIEEQDDSERISADSLTFKQGESLALVVGVGDGKGTGDSTEVNFRLTAEDGAVYDVNNDFSWERNPNGTWSYGMAPAGEQPNLDAFTLFEVGQKTLAFEPIGRSSNPASDVWQNELADTHPYKPVPHSAAIIEELRTHAKNGLPVFLSEYGIGSAVDLWRLTRYYEEYRAEDAADAKHYRSRYDRFMADWERWKLDEIFATPEDFFRQAIAGMAEQRRIGINAIRSNPNVVAHSVTGTHDQGISGEGLTTIFRELKPGTVDAMADVFAPVRFCNFVEPVQAYVGQKVRIESVLVNEDILPPGEYQVRYLVVGPKNERFFDETRTLTVPGRDGSSEPPFSIPAMTAEFVVPLTASEGECKFYAEIQQGGAAAGGVERFYTFDRRRFPLVGPEKIWVWGDDPDLLAKLRVIDVAAEPFTLKNGKDAQPAPGDRIVVGKTTNRKTSEEFAKLFNLAQSGVGVLFLSPDVFSNGANPAAMLPFKVKGEFNRMPNWLYHKDDWAKRDLAFDGLQAGCALDYVYYRDVVPVVTFKGQEPTPDVAIAGGFSTQMDYDSGLSMAEWRFGRGKIVLSTWLIQENLPSPIAERMLRNLLIKIKSNSSATQQVKE